MSLLRLSAAERRALWCLVGLTLTGSAVQLLKRYRPARVPDYVIEFDSTYSAASEPAADIPAAKLESGIDPNTAPQEDLELLPGIGPRLARRIVADREQHGRFHDASDLTRVSGIGPALVERLRPHLRFP